MYDVTYSLEHTHKDPLYIKVLAQRILPCPLSTNNLKDICYSELANERKISPQGKCSAKSTRKCIDSYL